MPSELSVIVKNEEKRMTSKHLIYEEYTVNIDDPIIAQLIDQAVKEFGATPDSVKIKINMEVR
jgi:hypothetical protein